MIRRRAQHQATDSIRVAAPTELRDRPAHGVTDSDQRLDAKMVGNRNSVVSTIGQAEVMRTDAAAVAAMVDDYQVKTFRLAAV